jgi:hypothetical protein
MKTEKRLLINKILLSLFLLCAIFSYKTEVKAQIVYNHVFNPMNGLVHESEKPLRDEGEASLENCLYGVLWDQEGGIEARA